MAAKKKIVFKKKEKVEEPKVKKTKKVAEKKMEKSPVR